MGELHEIMINGAAWNLSVGLAGLARNRYRIDRARHCNSGYEVTLILQGSCILDVGSHHYTLQAGQAAIIAPGCYHTLRSAPGEFDHFTLRISLPKGHSATNIRQQIPDHRVFPITDKMMQLCCDIFDVHRAKGLYWQDTYSTQLKLLVLHLLRQLNIADALHHAPPYKTVRKHSSQIYEYINENLAAEPSIDGLAQKMQLSPRQTRRILRNSCGMGLREMLLNARMDRSQWLLRTTDKSPSEIAAEVGYSEAAFYRAFHNHFHMTPKQYRLQAGKPDHGHR